jgi:S-adenosylmethionine synthetase
MRVIVTGASGLLGSAIYKAFTATTQDTVLGLAHTRATGSLHALDLTKANAVEETFSKFFEGNGRKCEPLGSV